MRRTYLFSYDISDRARLRAIHRLARAYGTAVQFSVFLCYLSRTDRMKLAMEIGAAINHVRDRVILVDLGEERSESWIASFEIFGRQEIARPRKHVVV